MTKQTVSVALKRAYDEPAAIDGTGVLVKHPLVLKRETDTTTMKS